MPDQSGSDLCLLRGVAENEIEARSKPGITIACRFEVCRDQRPLFGGDPVEQKIVGILRFTLDIDLGNQGGLPSREHRCVYVRCSAGIPDRADGTKPVVSVCVGDGVAVPLEILILYDLPVIAWMMVAAVGIALPYLDANAGHRPSVWIYYPTRQVRNLPFRKTAATGHPREVVIVIQWQLFRIERAGALSWRR